MRVFGGGAFGRCLGYEGEILRNGIGVHIKETPESFLAPFHHVRIQQEGIYEPESELSPDTGSAGTSNPDFPASRAMRSESLLHISHRVYGFVIAARMDYDRGDCVDWGCQEVLS